MPHLPPKVAYTSIEGTLTAKAKNVMSSFVSSKRKVVLCISGMGGSGKSTLAKKIAKKYGWVYYSGGDALKALALDLGHKSADRGWWESQEGRRFLKERIHNSSFDKKVDGKLLEWAKQGDVVLDSWTMPWLIKRGFKIWLEASLEERTKRIAERDGLSTEKALKALKEKDARTKTIYKGLYGFDLGDDFSPFDLILDVNGMSSREVFETVSLVIERMLRET